MLDVLEVALRKIGQEKLVIENFTGLLLSCIECVNCHNVILNDEPFVVLSLSLNA